MCARDIDEGPQSHSELLKVEYDRVMIALYRCMKRFCTPGVQSGISELAVLLERSHYSLRNQFGPTAYDHAPTVHTFLKVIETLESREAVEEIAALAGCVTIPRSPKAKAVGAPDDDAAAFAALSQLVDRELRSTNARLQEGGRLAAPERDEARDALFNIVAYAAHLLTRLR
ncbi:MAG: hypothetical protein AzoDbin1_02141 [Azoarcus sp.]|nr:hypothetical protein [Azoarcus sp.]